MNIATIRGFKTLYSLGKGFVQANRPEILFGASIASSAGATVMAAIGGYKARGKVESEKIAKVMAEVPAVIHREDLEAMLNDEKFELSTKEKALLTWKDYVPAGLVLMTSVSSTTGLHVVHVKEKKALAAAALSAIEEVRSSASEYIKQVEGALDEHLTEEQKAEVRNNIMEQNADENGRTQVLNSDGVIEELYLVRDSITGRDIWSNEQRIADALNELNRWITREGDSELNHFYSLAGFGHVPIGDDLGWSGEMVELRWDTEIRDDGRPVRRFTFRPAPKEGYASTGA